MTARQDGRIITFYSYKGGTGRTMALANTAWILAANGKRVLTVDWDLEAPGLDRFFRPFLDPNALAATTGVIDMITEYSWAATTGGPRSGSWHLDYARVEPHAMSLNPEVLGLSFPDGGSLDFLSAGRQNREYSATVSSFEWDNFYERLGGGLFLDALRDDMRASYDYVLIDSRTGLSDNADICTIQMPDVLVDCFTLSGQSMDGAAAVAHSVEEDYRKRRIRVLPVPMRIDEGEKEKVDAGRALARQKFDGLPKGPDGEHLDPADVNAYWGAVEIPYRPYYAYEEMLATVGDESGIANSLLSAFERLTSVITDGEVTQLPPIPEQVRLRCVEAFTRRRPQLQSVNAVVVYAAENRMWAEWVQGVLRTAGCDAALHDVSTGPPERPDTTTRVLVLLSHAFQKSRAAGEVWHALRGGAADAPHSAPVALRVDEVRLADSSFDREPVDLHRLDEADCVRGLLGALGLAEQPTGSRTAGPRFPGSVPQVWNAPQRNTTFTGRGVILDQLREQLRGGMSVVLPQAQALFGLGGVGKTQVALEYVHRFMADYDLVWWVSAEDIDNVVSSLAQLGTRIGALGGEDMAMASQEAVQLLARGVPTNRWILVFDNADDPTELKRFFPRGGGGHILVTSRNQAWAQQGASLPVDVFQRQESVEHLSLRAPGLSAEEADRVAEAVGDLPLAVEQAAAWLYETATPVKDYLRLLAEQTTDVLDLNQAADYPKTVAATWNISIARLKERSPASVRMLQLCAFMAAEPIASQLLYSKEMLDELRKVDRTLTESLMLGRVIREIARFALAKVDQVGNSIQIHRLVQAVIRSQLTEDEQRTARQVVHTILAGARPDGDEPTDDPKNWPQFELLWPHLRASDIGAGATLEPRRLLIDRVRYLWKRGNLPQAQSRAEEVLAQWKPLLGEDHEQYLYMRSQLANVLRSQGRYVEALEMNEDVLERQRRVLGPTHPHTFITVSALSSDLAARGQYDRALELAREAHEGFGQIFHESHRRTLSAANNLALTLCMVGDYGAARDLDQDTYDRRKEVLGPEHPYTLASAQRLGRDLREDGRYSESADLLSDAYRAYKDTLGKDFPGTLTCAKSLAVSLRRAGRFEDAHRLSKATLAEYRKQYETRIPASLACELNLAADLFAADQREEARQVAQAVLGEYIKVPGEQHPYTQAALNNLGIYQWACGNADEAEALFLRVTERMAEVLGEKHPHTLFARANYANVLAERGRVEEAWAVEKPTRDTLQNVLGAQHPEALGVVANSALTLRALGRTEDAARLREETLAVLERQSRQLGPDNGITRLVRQERRIYRDLEPLAV
ncbi:FxSxx-COOH system tetratricopeptide repeat protein [Streptomyces ipomoeae]|uniref:FxSxx-COOH system tetratricopeptide repeat protein n=1 Tax=Streptomyces ipomoeae TaxID=103232 RepID=UPI0029BD651C|nr:FxSxx-COOH system tetratricopeptide repeat protein [Streptomyces ipomoeae]MDX2821971.1 FxSxx-COOH system tetratricopeptide repeat protein [Streptomyces ipomoeae]MDX2873805.1 FxSxx-COOH system tetratricopeptide repeat protein [Streptomyces ipomoeae]